ncbi:Nif3-like dinuclear metal center hexameric protein [Paludibacterium paludis]|uniref:GTP cyclohydrolase 1 type 2 homolog n=1 Tax=Paludibacterium paludis TaxID=1225769 RepID=A0A918NZ42_9NEIS|nr:Nif3-like dinuclear metal center hexameric protein [Paludibacterium paludis]GGY08366.1 GTP cyclohydrolase 1 type 2 [Paludibacterium paludis]
MNRNDLLSRMDTLLEPWRFSDYAPNGLQVEGRETVKRVVTGVTASQALIDEAVRLDADMVLVHHGYFWKGEDARVNGLKRRRLKTLLDHDINLVAYHLPLDAHPEVGNNATLAKRLGIEPEGRVGDMELLWHGSLARTLAGTEWADTIGAALGRAPLLLGRPDKPVRRVAWCTGGAQSYFQKAIDLGVDAFLTGEVSEQNHHMALEYDVLFISAGHHATERYGVQALGTWLADETGIDVQFVDLFNPV